MNDPKTELKYAGYSTDNFSTGLGTTLSSWGLGVKNSLTKLEHHNLLITVCSSFGPDLIGLCSSPIRDRINMTKNWLNYDND